MHNGYGNESNTKFVNMIIPFLFGIMVGMIVSCMISPNQPIVPIEDHNQVSAKLCEEKGGIPVWDRHYNGPEEYERCEAYHK